MLYLDQLLIAKVIYYVIDHMNKYLMTYVNYDVDVCNFRCFGIVLSGSPCIDTDALDFDQMFLGSDVLKMYLSINQSIYFNLHHYIQCYIYALYYSKYNSTQIGVVPKIKQYLSGGTTHE